MPFLFCNTMNADQIEVIRQRLQSIGEEINFLYLDRNWDKDLKERIRTITRLLKEARKALDDSNL